MTLGVEWLQERLVVADVSYTRPGVRERECGSGSAGADPGGRGAG
ncbi:MAG TPA: hypothetical protein VEB59_10170 [Gemmatimonadales bacterium]|nr:hypothetical protein [Gemmatimonadales bacterium]